MKIEINVQNAHLKAEEIHESHVTSIIEGFFGVLGVVKQVENNSNHCKKTNPLKNLGEAPVGYVPFQNINTSVTAVPTVAVKEEEKPQQISKVLPKINAERSLSAPIREVAKISLASDSEAPIFGTKEFEDGQIKYQCKYWCDCGHTGKRWVNDNAQHVRCHECNSKLIVEPATPEFRGDGLPVQDSFNNFFIAREMEGE